MPGFAWDRPVVVNVQTRTVVGRGYATEDAAHRDRKRLTAAFGKGFAVMSESDVQGWEGAR